MENKDVLKDMLSGIFMDREENLREDIEMTMLSRDYEKKGIVTNITYRHCAVCGYRPVYSVKWDDGKRTFPCPKGCEYTENDTIHII